MRLFVGIDGGGSGTRAALADAAGTVLATGAGGASNSLGGDAGRRRLADALEAALAPVVALLGSQACVVCAGVRGLSDPGNEPAVRAEIGRLLPSGNLRLETDARIALWGALAGEEGVAVLAGTGSIALARSADGREARAGGFGYLLGDEGSGYWLGRAAVAHCLAAAEGRAEPTALSQLILDAAGQSEAKDLVGWVYGASTPVARLSTLAPLVSRAALAGDAVARGLMARAGAQLARLALSAADRVWDAGRPAELRVAPCGGVWGAGRVLREPFEESLARELPAARVVGPRLPPTGGALLLAMGDFDAAVVSRLAAGLA